MNARVVWTIVAIAGIVAGIVIVAPFFTSSSRPAGPAGLAGEPAPIVTLVDATGTPVSLARYRGSVVVVNLWATWCPPCRAELPDLQRFSDAYGARGVTVVGINQGESPQRALEFARSLGIRFPIWLDERQQYGRAFAALGLPTTVVIGRDGTIVRGYDGALTFDQVRDAVAGLIDR